MEWSVLCVYVVKTGAAVSSVKMQYVAVGLRPDSWTVSAVTGSWWNWACAKRWLFFSHWDSFSTKALIGIQLFYSFLLFFSWVLRVESSLPPVMWAALLIAWLQSGPPGQNVPTPVEAKVWSPIDIIIIWRIRINYLLLFVFFEENISCAFLLKTGQYKNNNNKIMMMINILE